MSKILGVDFGKSRIGVALGEEGYVEPLKIISGKSWKEFVNELKKIIEENEISCIVLGSPAVESSPEVKKFCEFLSKNVSIKVVNWDESFTSKEALEYAVKAGYSRRRRRHLDDLSASLLLERYYEETGCS